jgi:hypothetical protein
MDSNDKHEAKASDPNSVTVDGDSKTTINKEPPSMKGASPIYVTEVGIQTDFKEIQSAKTRKGIM